MHDVIIAGGGPAGTSAASMLARLRRKVLLIDAGQGRNATADSVHNLIGSDGAAPAALRATWQAELDRYPDAVTVRGEVRFLSGGPDAFEARLADGTVERARRVVLATGVRDVLPPVPGLAELWGSSVLHCVYCHGWEVRDQPLAVLARTGEEADWAMSLRRFSTDLMVLTDGNGAAIADKDRLAEHGVDLLDEPLERFHRSARHGVVIETRSGRRVPRRAVFVVPDVRQRSDLAATAGCRFADNGLVLVDSLQRTSVPGIRAIGDMAKPVQARVKAMQVVVAAAEGVNVAVALDAELAG
ncbi:NAD(P)/FAD-dependent oxidoreductase [Streptomyces sp. CL12]|uniref:NAD(P)/FAD-dependent oxidoreductase n=1 Tax=Streptomyces sp. CL12 TaxID=3391744 RepID=UPI003A804988